MRRKPVLQVASATAYTAASGDIGGADGVINVPRGGKLEISWASSVAGVFNIRINGVNLPAELGATLVAEAPYAWEYGVNGGEDVSFRYSVDTTIRNFTVNYIEGNG